MAIGDEAKSAGYQVVPNAGEDGRVKYGAREINRTRDYIAVIWKLLPKSKGAYRQAAGIRFGPDAPSGGEHGDIYLRTYS